jgi:DNA topoisomerase-1
LLKYRGDDGRTHRVTSSDVNAYLREAGRGEFTAKDFRTWVASVEAVRLLTQQPAPGSNREIRGALRDMFDCVAANLGNTPTICKKCYVHPLIVKSFADGTLARLMRHSDGEGQGQAEAVFLRLLRAEQRSRRAGTGKASA